jgi:hypothetical protein
MLDPKAIFEEAKRTGRIWLGGEHEFPFGITCDQAYHRLLDICCACGGVVSRRGRSMLTLSLSHEVGYYMLDWYDADRPGPEVIHLWMPKTAFASDHGLKSAR